MVDGPGSQRYSANRARRLGIAIAVLFFLGADGQGKQKLAPALRAKLGLALAGLALLGLALMALTYLGGHFVRRLARHAVPSHPPGDDRWYAKPLASSTEHEHESGDGPAE